MTPPLENSASIALERGEPWGARLWLLLLAVVGVAACMQSYGISTWPMADDEVPTLVELGLADIGAEAFSVPPSQVGRLPKTLPVWYGFQGVAIRLLPDTEVSYRLPSVACGVLMSGLVFLIAARWRGLWFALALSIVLNGSLPFVYLAQLNRFYSMPLLLLTVTLTAILVPRGGILLTLATAGLAALTVLSHNLTLAVFGVAFVAAVCAFILRLMPVSVVQRSATALGVSLLLYFTYLRPLVSGWHSTGNPTPVLVSFVAHLGVPTLALALLGAGFALRRSDRPQMAWWLLVFIGGFCAFQFGEFNWNPRYFVFFMPASWVLAAHAMARVASSLGRGVAGAGWYACVALLFMPSLISHYQDGSRHDYRQAAAVVAQAARNGQPILSDDAETISYYLPVELRRSLRVRTKVPLNELPDEEFLLVARSNAWGPLPRFRDRHLDVLAEISRRRMDQFSHVLRVFRVGPRGDQGR